MQDAAPYIQDCVTLPDWKNLKPHSASLFYDVWPKEFQGVQPQGGLQ